MKDEDGDILFTSEAIDSCATGIAAGSADDGDSFGGRIFGSVEVFAVEEELEEVTEELESDILEGERRPMPKLDHVSARSQLLQRGDGWVAEGAVGTLDQLFQFRTCDLLARDE
ncbi:hypothetical protein PGTUg99_001764 [Puccinia graminis f. sp. tritici]|uniref:Uncharacterized protein n=1 Tax=Puccinia graminis f. sp. tritici TaxID=56615 RepID=A0A5B0R6A6_PUCGR|nr:hypothetical protein PGTUg99_001764 [Puccinia graminis f. sp. tritici]